jgi:uncharacterized membrane protein
MVERDGPIKRRAEEGAVPPLERVRKRLTTGLLLAIPALVTFWVIEITLELLVAAGEPLAHILAGSVRPLFPGMAEWLLSDSLRWAVAILLMLGLFYGLGSVAAELGGRRILERIEGRVLAIPGIDLIYGAVRDLVASLKREDFAASRVVLIEFPGPHMRTIGFVTRLLEDRDTGRPLAAVYVPTTPNPTSGYIEIVPVDRLVWLDWTPQEAMRFVVSGGVAGPETVSFESSSGVAPPGSAPMPSPVPPPGEPERSSIQVRAESGAAER